MWDWPQKSKEYVFFFSFYYIYLLFFDSVSYVAQAGLELMGFLPYRNVPPCLPKNNALNIFKTAMRVSNSNWMPIIKQGNQRFQKTLDYTSIS